MGSKPVPLEPYKWQQPNPPTRCPNGHQLGPNGVHVSWVPCTCIEGNNGHLNWTCRTCRAEINDPECVDPTRNVAYRPR